MSYSETVASCNGSHIIRIYLTAKDVKKYGLTYSLIDDLFRHNKDADSIYHGMKILSEKMGKSCIKEND
jgi:hypothetical protein